MKYTLIAFKPEDVYYCGIHSAELIRKDDLTKEEIINEIFKLSKDPEYLTNPPRYTDSPYNEFHIFEFDEKRNDERFLDFYNIELEGRKLAREFNEEGKRKQIEKELEKKRLEYEKLKLEFEGKK